mmetsp:Transcript_5986/g.6876  ORF Transcript_5986/g.6876 Transcript_5986/m.6876 type:complete len:167 (+) Transcript_5986:144-644(+)|eukprot:CAMPEP_0184008006 /NCGR_PEP_ID=MMETSP0954-20121128/1696_1 /TAXON_ID=627963 /ORGANISM="Aplanochytrium sp, Strain PBS07" /LENGTH=166 /DNA_ID=CAMNT_0026286993 /DNA_START=123 /DNA_END=623 /DNA_ORIENTATION=-
MFKLKVKKLSADAILPTRGSPLSAGYDLYSAVSNVVPARGKALCKTDIAIACPPNTYGRIAPRSGLAWKKSIDVGAGVVDADYRGNVGVILFNLSDKDFEVKKGDRIAQLILEEICMADIEEVEDLDATERGHGGFGSTGVGKQAAVTKTEESENSQRQPKAMKLK